MQLTPRTFLCSEVTVMDPWVPPAGLADGTLSPRAPQVCSGDLGTDGSPCSPLALQVVVLCFAVAFGSFFQGYGPYPSATKMALPSQHSVPEPYTASIGKTAPGDWGSVRCQVSAASRKLSFLKGVSRESLDFKKVVKM